MIEINRNPSQSELRWFGLLQPVFFGLVGLGLYRNFGYVSLPLALFAVSLLIAVVGWLAPAYLRTYYVGWMLAVFPIGWVVSHLLLAVIFYLVVTPIGLIMRWTGYDPMQRRWDREATTYWVERPPQPSAKRYFRQF